MAFYTVAEAVTELKKIMPLNTDEVFMGPLSGNPHGRIFRTERYPLVPGSLTSAQLFYSDGTSASGIFSSVHEPTGTVLTSASPTQGLLATYTVAEFTDPVLNGFVERGLDLLETRWARGYSWVGGNLVDADGNDPEVGNSATFSESLAEKGLLLIGATIRMAEARWQYAASHAFAYRSSIGGMMVDKSRQPDALKNYVEYLTRQLDDAVIEVSGGYNDGAGATFIPSFVSSDYAMNFSWQIWARDNLYNQVRQIA